jgi:hypothetical protein
MRDCFVGFGYNNETFIFLVAGIKKQLKNQLPGKSEILKGGLSRLILECWFLGYP